MTLPDGRGDPITSMMIDDSMIAGRAESAWNDPSERDERARVCGNGGIGDLVGMAANASRTVMLAQTDEEIISAVRMLATAMASSAYGEADASDATVLLELRDSMDVARGAVEVPANVMQGPAGEILGLVAAQAGTAMGCRVLQAASAQAVSSRQVAEFESERLRRLFDRRLEAALAERSIWAEVFKGSQYGVCIIGTDLRYLSFNPAFEEWFSRHGVIPPMQGQPVADALSTRPEVFDEAKACWHRALGGEDFTHSWCIISRGREFHYETRYTPLYDETGEVKAAVQFSLDVSDRIVERRRLEVAEEALRQSQKMEAVGKLTGGIAHDFNNILTGIVGAIDIIGRKMSEGKTEAVPRYLDMAATSANRAASLTHRLLAFSRRQPVDPRLTDVDALVLGMGEMITRTLGPDILVETSTSGLSARVLCDASQLESAIMNLVVNSREAMPTGGRVLIATGTVEIDDAPAGADLRPGLFMRIAVSDSGTGMTPEVLSRATEPFYTTKGIGNGTGLGLSMVYGFARQTGGYLDIRSDEADGTTVSIFLPATTVVPVVEAEPSDPIRIRRDATVLVVEDEPAVRAIVVELLEEMGCRVLQAEDGGVGASILSSDVSIDVLVTDIGLPVLNGRQVATAARSSRPGIPILFMTGYSDNAAITEGFTGRTTLVTKPFRPAQIADAMERLLG